MAFLLNIKSNVLQIEIWDMGNDMPTMRSQIKDILASRKMPVSELLRQLEEDATSQRDILTGHGRRFSARSSVRRFLSGDTVYLSMATFQAIARILGFSLGFVQPTIPVNNFTLTKTEDDTDG